MAQWIKVRDGRAGLTLSTAVRAVKRDSPSREVRSSGSAVSAPSGSQSMVDIVGTGDGRLRKPRLPGQYQYGRGGKSEVEGSQMIAHWRGSRSFNIALDKQLTKTACARSSSSCEADPLLHSSAYTALDSPKRLLLISF